MHKARAKQLRAKKVQGYTKTQLAYITTKTSNAQKTREIEMNKVIDTKQIFKYRTIR